MFYLAVTLLALFIGAISSPFYGFGFALAVLAVSLLFHLVNLWRVPDWLKTLKLHEGPGSILLWQEVFDRIYDQVRMQHKRKKQLATTLERFLSAAEALPDGVVMLDEHDRIEWCNPAAASHLGLDRRADIGQQITNLVRYASLREYLREEDFSHPLQLRIERAQELVLTIQLVPFDSTRKLLQSRDITQLDRVQTVHRDFVANVSHELRTPLTVVGGFLETMLDMPDTDAETRARHLQLMYEQTRRMQRLVEDLLTLSKLESGQQTKEEEVDMGELLRLLQDEALGLSQGRHRIELDVLADVRLLGNRDELQSACGNLVSNAIRYTPAGGAITLKWGIREGHPVFAVQDSGIGIAPEHIPRLTERFYRVDRGRSRATGGTGVGGAIVKHILQRHQARLLITSKLGEGSEFAVHFPAERLLH